MAFEARDGRKFSMASRMRSHNEGIRAKEGMKVDLGGNSQAGDVEDAPEQEDGHQIAQEHGPADEVHIEHSEGTHHVHSLHPDGHEHHSEHHSRKEAHEHAAKLGGGHEESEEGEQDLGSEREDGEAEEHY